MTREEIMAMEAGRGLNVLIAKEIMKWSITVNIFFEDDDPKRFYYAESIPTAFVEDWNPSTDISAAWEVVEKLQPTLWVRMNSMMDEHYCGVGSPDMLWEYKSKSMPECICKAALLAVMEENT